MCATNRCLDMTTINYRLNRAARDRLVSQIVDKVERGVPDGTIERWLLHETKYTYSGIRNLMKEAHLRADRPQAAAKGERLA